MYDLGRSAAGDRHRAVRRDASARPRFDARHITPKHPASASPTTREPEHRVGIASGEPAAATSERRSNDNAWSGADFALLVPVRRWLGHGDDGRRERERLGGLKP
jgi:hypothetical protein